jgi:hypothetical protein
MDKPPGCTLGGNFAASASAAFGKAPLQGGAFSVERRFLLRPEL